MESEERQDCLQGNSRQHFQEGVKEREITGLEKQQGKGKNGQTFENVGIFRIKLLLNMKAK